MQLQQGCDLAAMIGAVIDDVAQHLGGRDVQDMLLLAPLGHGVECVIGQFAEQRVQALADRLMEGSKSDRFGERLGALRGGSFPCSRAR